MDSFQIVLEQQRIADLRRCRSEVYDEPCDRDFRCELDDGHEDEHAGFGLTWTDEMAAA